VTLNMCSSVAILFATFAVSALGESTFVESPVQPGVWFNRNMPAQTSPPATAGPKMASAGVTSVGGLNDPGAIIRHGNFLYVGNDGPTITVIDATTPGAEFVSQTITTPIHPIDLAISFTELYVVDQKRDTVWHKPLTSGSWTSIALPTATWEWTYGNICFPHPTLPRLYVIQMWDNLIQVVDLTTYTLLPPITQLHHLPTSIAFSGDGTKLAVLCTGLSAPSCGASGPNLAVFDSTSHAKLYEVDLQGTCSRAIVADGNDAFVVRDTDLRKYDLPSGLLIDNKSGGGGRNAAHNGTALITQDFAEHVSIFSDDLDHTLATYDVVFGPQVWLPPIEEMVAFGASDGRVFVTCRNDDSVSIIHHDFACYPYGKGCPGAGGFVPKLAGAGCPHPNQSYALSVIRGLGGAMALFFAGTAQANVPLGGGCAFLLSPVLAPVLTIPLTGSGAGNGSLALSVLVPSSLPVGLPVNLQVFVQDVASPIGASASNGLQLVIKP
jgi:hypothetical protein